MVGNARGLLEVAGIEVITRNEYSQGGVGELSAFDVWPSLWVVRDRDYERAVTLLETSVSPVDQVAWRCTVCTELNDESFEFCWQCGDERRYAVQ